MANILIDEDHYVLLMPGCPEEFVTAGELAAFLTNLLTEYPEAVDGDLKQFDTPTQQAQRLIQTSCELPLAPGETVEWYAVRLSKDRGN